MHKLFFSFLLSLPILASTTHLNVNGYLFQVNQYGPVAPGNIYTTLSMGSFNANGLVLLTKDAKKVLHFRKGSYFDFKKHPNGLLSACVRGRGTHPRWDLWNEAFESAGHFPNFPLRQNQRPNFHDFLMLENGNNLFISDITSRNPNQKINIVHNLIQEVTHTGEVIFEWDTSHYFSPHDIKLLNVQQFIQRFRHLDLYHMNACFIDLDDNIIISCRHINEVTKIDRMTGDIIWRLGGNNNEFMFIDDPFHGVSHQHNPSILPNGNLLIYDNGNTHIPPTTRIVEYEIDEVNKVAKLVWEYRAISFTEQMGSCQRLSNGNTLICWGHRHDNPQNFLEVDADKNVVLEIIGPKAPFCAMYRAFKIE